MVKLHGSVFIIIGLITGIISSFIEGMIIFVFVGVGLFTFGIVKLFINGGKLTSREDIRKSVLERRSSNKYNRPEDRQHRRMVSHHQQRVNHLRRNHPNNHHVNVSSVGNSMAYHSNPNANHPPARPPVGHPHHQNSNYSR